MRFIEDTAGHVHDAAYAIPVGCTVARCKHCHRHIRPDEHGRWRPIALEPSDFKRRKDVGDYLVFHPDRQDDHGWLACVWNFSNATRRPIWRHDNMPMSHPGFRTMREAVADRCAA